MPTIREQIENHPLIIFGSAFVAGAVFSFGAYQFFLHNTDRVIVFEEAHDQLKERAKRVPELEKRERDLEKRERDLEEEVRTLKAQLDRATQAAKTSKSEPPGPANPAQAGAKEARTQTVENTAAKSPAAKAPVTEAPTIADLPRVVVGTWSVVDPRLQRPINSITLREDGQYEGGPWGREFGGPNGLGANRWRLDGDILSFVYVAAGRARIDTMLAGRLKPVTSKAIDFEVTGGAYGSGKNLGFALQFTR